MEPSFGHPGRYAPSRADPQISSIAPGSALDNAASESFNSTLEFELLSRRHFLTREQARHAVAAWIDEYNTDRRHSTNGMLSPVDYELACATRPAIQHDVEQPGDGRAA